MWLFFPRFIRYGRGEEQAPSLHTAWHRLSLAVLHLLRALGWVVPGKSPTSGCFIPALLFQHWYKPLHCWIHTDTDLYSLVVSRYVCMQGLAIGLPKAVFFLKTGQEKSLKTCFSNCAWCLLVTLTSYWNVCFYLLFWMYIETQNNFVFLLE